MQVVDRNEVDAPIMGVIVPPPEIRAIVDKTAQFVARNGKSFEERILKSGEGHGAKFDFMKISSPYHAYYEEKIAEFEKPPEEKKEEEAGGGTAEVAPTAEEEGDAEGDEMAVEGEGEGAEVTIKASKISPIERFALTATEHERPSELAFITAHPQDASAQEVDVIRLTARYTAIRGQQFLLGVAEREANNPEFMFLQPTHPHFNYFTHLVDCYARALSALKDGQDLNALNKRSTKMGVLEAVVHRWVWCIADEETARMANATDEDRMTAAAIDWHDFSVVATIDFDEEEKVLSEQMDAQQDDGAMQVGDEEDKDEDEEVRIVRDDDYVAPAAEGGAVNFTMKDPVSGLAVPVDDVAEHMRIQLIDPKWASQQQVHKERQADTGFAAGASIAASLKQFALRRGAMGSTVVSQVSGKATMGEPSNKRTKE